MNSTAVLAGIAMVGGMAVALQGQFMGQMDRNIGTAESVFITYGIGFVIVGLLMLFLKGGPYHRLQCTLMAWRLQKPSPQNLLVLS